MLMEEVMMNEYVPDHTSLCSICNSGAKGKLDDGCTRDTYNFSYPFTVVDHVQ